MREIRFRAWDKLDNRMVEVDRLIWNRAGELDAVCYKPSLVKSECLVLEDIELMQYTGLKDKNGKEIYEGDIVKARSRGVNCVYEVYWEERSCQFRCCAHSDRQFDKTHLMDWADEVIGNIYENKELLEGE